MKNKIDIKKWKEFNISDLFEVKLSRDDLQPGKLIEGNIPLISSGKTNNGIVMYIEEQPKATLFDKNTITIDMFGQAFYQITNYYAVSHGRVNILIPKFKLTKNIGLFLVSIFKKSFNERYSFSTMCSSTLLKKEKILLPVDEQINPDWKYMEQYMKTIEENVNESLKGLNIESNKFKKVNIIKWKEFVLEDLFKFVNSTAYHQKNVKDADGLSESIAYVTRSKLNNGLNKYVIKEPYFNVNPANTISFGAENANFFYQPEPYITGNKMYYIDTSTISKYACLYIKTILEATFSSKYSFSDGMIPNKIKRKAIKLPIDKNGNPDWDYMEQYMMNLLKDTRDNLNHFKYI